MKLPYIDKLQDTQEMIEVALDGLDLIAIAFSGGKDSTAIAKLIRDVRPDATLVHCNTTVRASEVNQYIKTLDNLIEIKGDRGYWNVIDEYGLPGFKGEGKKRTNWCCWHLKEKPQIKWINENKPDLLVTGLTMAESHQRAMRLSHDGPFSYVKSWNVAKLHPIWNWYPDDVWRYIKENNLAYCSKYDKGSKRIGCITCTAFRNWQYVMIAEYPTLYYRKIVPLARQGMQQNLDQLGLSC